MSDPTAAERARRYRARRAAQRDGSVTSRPALEAQLVEMRASIAQLVELVGTLIHTVEKRDENGRHAVQRDVTERHAPEGAPARTRVGTRLSAPSGPREPYVNHRDVTPADAPSALAGRIIEVLGRAHTPQSAAPIADALELPAAAVLAELATLGGLGLVHRLAPETATGPIRWGLEPVVESPAETIRCSAYHEHARLGHRRDPVTQRFRCYVCEPDVGQQSVSM